jgi:hypothetical protein
MVKVVDREMNRKKSFDREVPLDPALQSGVKGHTMNEATLPRSPAL